MSGLQIALGSSSAASSENWAPRILARVGKEVKSLHKSPPEGVRLVLDSDLCSASLTELVAEIEGPTDTPYEGKYFQLKLCLPRDFPASPPRGFFITKIYHPNVDMSNGSICVNTLKKDWTESTTLSHVLSVIRCLLIIPFPESSLNDEAGKFFMDSYDEYARRAKLMANIHGKPRPCTSYLSEKKDDPNTDTDVPPIAVDAVCPADGVENQIHALGKKEDDTAPPKKAKKDDKTCDKSKAKKKKNLKRL